MTLFMGSVSKNTISENISRYKQVSTLSMQNNYGIVNINDLTHYLTDQEKAKFQLVIIRTKNI